MCAKAEHCFCLFFVFNMFVMAVLQTIAQHSNKSKACVETTHFCHTSSTLAQPSSILIVTINII